MIDLFILFTAAAIGAAGGYTLGYIKGEMDAIRREAARAQQEYRRKLLETINQKPKP